MSIRSRKCGECGAPVEQGVRRCPYCGVWFDETPSAVAPDGAEFKPQRLDPAVGEFGLRGRTPYVVGIVGAVVLYVAGWFLEDTQYWLAKGAAAVWGGVLPLWLFAVALGWRPRRGGIWAGLAIAVPIVLVHLTLMWLIRGRLNDDYVGIAVAFGGAAFVGWALGRSAHEIIRRLRGRTGR